jgi:hypothetical protein
MPSATTADNSDSIAPSNAMVNAGPTKDRTRAGSSEGSDNAGMVRGIPPKAEPMVVTPLK